VAFLSKYKNKNEVFMKMIKHVLLMGISMNALAMGNDSVISRNYIEDKKLVSPSWKVLNTKNMSKREKFLEDQAFWERGNQEKVIDCNSTHAEDLHSAKIEIELCEKKNQTSLSKNEKTLIKGVANTPVMLNRQEVVLFELRKMAKIAATKMINEAKEAKEDSSSLSDSSSASIYKSLNESLLLRVEDDLTITDLLYGKELIMSINNEVKMQSVESILTKEIAQIIEALIKIAQGKNKDKALKELNSNHTINQESDRSVLINLSESIIRNFKDEAKSDLGASTRLNGNVEVLNKVEDIIANKKAINEVNSLHLENIEEIKLDKRVNNKKLMEKMIRFYLSKEMKNEFNEVMKREEAEN
jgi:hypothetical protein